MDILKYKPINCKLNVPPFLLGIARLFDFTALLNKPVSSDKSELEVDIQALSEDFKVVLKRENL